MQDKTTIGNNENAKTPSKAFREYLESLVEEVILNGAKLNDHKKYLQRYSKEEGINYETIESNLNDLFEAIKELEEHESKTTERFVRSLAQSCNCSKTEVDKFINYATVIRAQKKAEEKAQQERDLQAQEKAEQIEKERLAAERKAKREAQKKAKEKAEREAKEVAERKAREERERKAKEEDERKAKEEAERKDKEERERRLKEKTERKKKEEAERKAREEEKEKEVLRKKNKSIRAFFVVIVVIISVLEACFLGWWCIPALITNFVWAFNFYQDILLEDRFVLYFIVGLVFVTVAIWSPSFRWWSLLICVLSFLLSAMIIES